MIELKAKFSRDEIEKVCVEKMNQLFPAPNGFHYEANSPYSSYGEVTVELKKDEETQAQPIQDVLVPGSVVMQKEV